MATLATNAQSFGGVGVIEARTEDTIQELRIRWSEDKALRMRWAPDTDSHGRIIMRPHWVEEVE